MLLRGGVARGGKARGEAGAPAHAGAPANGAAADANGAAAADANGAAAPAATSTAPLVRIHSECATGDLFGSMRCDCGPQLQRSLVELQKAESGCLVYLRGHEGRGIGLHAKLAAYAIQDAGRDTVEANLDLGHSVDARSYEIAAAVLADLGIDRVRLLTNNPAKCDALTELGIAVEERVPLVTTPNEENYKYLLTKQRKMGHLLGLPDAPSPS